jgi:drug/metabolite transporter (DMT)-like permease
VSLATQPEAARPAVISPGIRAMAIGAFWFSIMGLLVKLAGRRLGSMEIVLSRGVLTLGLSWWSLRRLGVSPWGTQRRLLVVRGTLGSTALLCYFYSLVHLPLGEATLIQNMNPVFATVLAAIILDEALRAPEILCLVASLVGVVFVAHPSWLFGAPTMVAESPWPVVIALLGALCSGAAYTLVRKMRSTEHSLVIVFYLPLLSVPISLPLALAEWQWPTAWEWVLLVGVGITTQLAQVSMTRGLQLERTARATTTGYLQVAFAVMWGALLLGEIPDVWTLAGAVTIIGSTLVLSWWHASAAVTDAG